MTPRRRSPHPELKRLLDVLLSAGALVVLSPFMALIWLCVRTTSPGPGLHRQTRLGLHGRPFRLYKFRSMIQDAERRMPRLAERNEMDGPVFKMRHDPRVTPVGRWLRRWSLDELPQLLNVLKGEMSLVGPRPPLPQEVSRYGPTALRRLEVKPGLTCYWQVQGRNELSFEEWLRLDLQYVEAGSLLDDLRILARTVPAVLSSRGAW